MGKKRQIIDRPMYAIVNKNSEVFSGLLKGYPQWSSDWNDVKLLFQENTDFIYNTNPTEYELINENEL
jgi:hypothetical protein